MATSGVVTSEVATSEVAVKRAKAKAWVNGYTATAVGTVLATAHYPGAATKILGGLEQMMFNHIGRIYGHEVTAPEATMASGVIRVASHMAKFAAEAALLTGPFAFAIKPVIAAAIVKAMGEVVIRHFENCS